jgi:ergothioneine biosynthesis protein EgtB
MPAPERKSRRVASVAQPAPAMTHSLEPLPQYFARVRARTDELVAPLSEADCTVQSMPDASPGKWHLGHTTWFFETFILERFEPDFKPFHDAFRVMFNSYYNGVGDKHPRGQRGLLTRPALSMVKDYRAHVNERILRLLAEQGGDQTLKTLLVLGLNHEQQHQELIVTDIKHLLSTSPLRPAYHAPQSSAAVAGTPLAWQKFAGGLATIGNDGAYFCFDNEMPQHRAFIECFQLATRLVTNREYLEFVQQGGYRDPALWLSEGWDWVRNNQLAHPCYWFQDGDSWQEFTLTGGQALAPDLPAVHLSYFEADAFARWAGARLPTEAEWEHAAAGAKGSGAFADNGVFHPSAARAFSPESGPSQLFGDAWEWTQSSYSPYPGFRQSDGAIGEYNGKFMVNQYVLRGGSCATPADHIRLTYRNFFPATARWQFSGIRLARD